MLAIALVLHAIITLCNGTGAHVAKKKNRFSLLTDDDEAFRYLLSTPLVSFLVLHVLFLSCERVGCVFGFTSRRRSSNHICPL